MERKLDNHSLDTTTENVDTIKRMLSMGLYQYLKLPVPACIAEDVVESSTVRRWSADATKHQSFKHEKVATVSTLKRMLCLSSLANFFCT